MSIKLLWNTASASGDEHSEHWSEDLIPAVKQWAFASVFMCRTCCSPGDSVRLSTSASLLLGSLPELHYCMLRCTLLLTGWIMSLFCVLARWYTRVIYHCTLSGSVVPGDLSWKYILLEVLTSCLSEIVFLLILWLAQRWAWEDRDWSYVSLQRSEFSQFYQNLQKSIIKSSTNQYRLCFGCAFLFQHLLRSKWWKMTCSKAAIQNIKPNGSFFMTYLTPSNLKQYLKIRFGHSDLILTVFQLYNAG